MRSILAQLVQQISLIPESLRTYYEKHQHGQPLETGLLDVIKSLLEEGNQTFIIIDALDECPSTTSERADLLDLVRRIHSWAQPNLHLLVTSRKEVDIREALESIITLGPISIQAGNIESDIRKYVRSQLESDSKLKKWQGEIRTEIEDSLVKGADGM